jgi:hypothetical protein
MVKPPLSIAWVKLCFHPDYVKLLMTKPREWHRVVVGEQRADEKPPPNNYVTKIMVPYPQGKRDRCLFLCLASALDYMGLKAEAFKLSEMASKGESLPGKDGIRVLTACMKKCAPSLAIPTIFQESQKKRKRIMTPEDLEDYNPYPTVVIPFGKDGSISHAICVIDDLIFDTTQAFALKCTRQSINWICNCGSQGFEDIYAAYRFERGFNCKTHIRQIACNWEGGNKKKAARRTKNLVVDEESYIIFGVVEATDKSIDKNWQHLRNRGNLLVDGPLSNITVNPSWWNEPYEYNVRCKDCGERPCIWLSNRHELMVMMRTEYNTGEPPNIIQRMRLYHEFVRYMNRRGIGKGVRDRLPECVEDGVHEIYPG